MKNLILIILILIPTLQMRAQDSLAVDNRPEPLAKKTFEFPEYTYAMLDNGIKLYQISDNEQPTITVRILIGGGSSQEIKTGVADLTAEMLTKGAGEYSAFDIASISDGLGSSIYASVGTDYMVVTLTTLVKHLPKLLPVLKAVVRQPNFPKDELKKLRSQFKSSIVSERGNPGSLASKLVRKVLYGDGHPYCNIPTLEDVDAIEVEDLKSYYERHFFANNMSIAVTGDFDTNILQSIYDNFSDMLKRDELEIKLPEPSPMPKGVYFISRPGSVQSSVRIFNPAPSYMDRDFERLSLASSIMGASFTGRLFRTLREKYSYTYTPSAGLTNNKYFNMFYAASDVKTDVTDSAISVIFEQMDDLRDNQVSKEELDNIKNYKIGSYYMSFENSGFITSLIQNSEFKGVRATFLETYTDRLQRFSEVETQRTIKRYMNSNDSYIVVVGDPSIKGRLEKYGTVYEFNNEIQPMFGANANYEELDMDLDDVIDNYTEAIGGKKNLKKVNTISSKGRMLLEFNGNPMKGTIEMQKKRPNLYHYTSMISSQTEEKWFDGTKAIASMNGMKQEQTDINPEQKLEFLMFGVTELEELGFELELLGKKDGMIVVKAKSNSETLYYFNESTFLLEKEVSTNETPNGPMTMTITYTKYGDVDGIKIPTVIDYDLVSFKFTQIFEHEINTDIDDSVFQSK